MAQATVSATAAPEVPEVAEKAHSLYARLGAEFLGTFIFIFAGIGGTLAVVQQNSASVQIALGFGLALVAVTVLFAKVSGGHFNPAVTLASAIAGRIKWIHALYYFVVQTVAGLFAVLVLFVVFNSLPVFRTPSTAGSGVSAVFKAAANGFDAASTAQVPLYSALLIEVVASTILVAVVLAAWRPGVNKAVAPIAIGFTYATMTLLLLPLTNSGLNPARSVSVIFFAGGEAITQVWVFIVAPLVGATLAGLVYRGFVVPDGDGPKKAVVDGIDDDGDVESDEAAETANSHDASVVPAAAAAEPARNQAAPNGPVANQPVASEPVTSEPVTNEPVTKTQSVVDDEAREFFDNKSKGSAEDK